MDPAKREDLALGNRLTPYALLLGFDSQCSPLPRYSSTPILAFKNLGFGAYYLTGVDMIGILNTILFYRKEVLT